MKSLFTILIVDCITCIILLTGTEAGLVLYTKEHVRNFLKKESSFNGCGEATEPFNCPGTNECISIQFICDGIPGDCPDNYDEDVQLCNAYERPPKDTIIKFLALEYNNHGFPFMVYLFGNKAASLFKSMPPEEAYGEIAKNLATSKTIDDFAKNVEMTKVERERLQTTLEKISFGETNNLPTFIKNSIGEGLSSLTENLKKTHFF